MRTTKNGKEDQKQKMTKEREGKNKEPSYAREPE